MMKTMKMMKIYSLVLIFISSSLVAQQNINIPDAKFKQKLILEGVDLNGDKEISVTEALDVTSLNLSLGRIKDLEGIQYFTNLTKLNCQANLHLSSIDLSQNVALTHLDLTQVEVSTIDLSHNTALVDLEIDLNFNLTSLDLSHNLLLKKLNISHTGIESMDFSKNPNLEELSAGQSFLTQIDVSKNLKLKELICFYSRYLKQVNLANGKNITKMFAYSSPLLSCIQVDASVINNIPSNWRKDSKANYSSNCYAITGMETLNSIGSISVYPNPAKDVIIVDNKSQIKVIKVRIMNLLGKEISVVNLDNKMIDISDLSTGVYILQLETEAGISNKRFVKE